MVVTSRQSSHNRGHGRHSHGHPTYLTSGPVWVTSAMWCERTAPGSRRKAEAAVGPLEAQLEAQKKAVDQALYDAHAAESRVNARLFFGAPLDILLPRRLEDMFCSGAQSEHDGGCQQAWSCPCRPDTQYFCRGHRGATFP